MGKLSLNCLSAHQAMCLYSKVYRTKAKSKKRVWPLKDWVQEMGREFHGAGGAASHSFRPSLYGTAWTLILASLGTSDAMTLTSFLTGILLLSPGTGTSHTLN